MKRSTKLKKDKIKDSANSLDFKRVKLFGMSKIVLIQIESKT